MVGLFLYIKSLWNYFPIHNFPKIFQILCSSISIIDIVCMLPYITSEKRNTIRITDWCSSIGCWDYFQISIYISNQPCPTRTKCCQCYLIEFYYKCFKIAPFIYYSIMKSLGRNMMSHRCKWIKIKCMIPYLSSIVKYSATCRSNNLFQTHILEFRTIDQIIEIINICLMMFSRMKLESLLTDIRSKRIDFIWKRRSSIHNI